jgi:heme/copper-type cytochrome/quinol oxidase subunit 4
VELKDVVTLYFERANAMQTFWSFYITIILALLAFFSSAKLGKKAVQVGVILSLAFAFFAAVNLWGGLREVTHQRKAVADLIHNWNFEDGKQPEAAGRDKAMWKVLEPTMHAPPWNEVVLTHLIGDVLTLVAIWFVASKQYSSS